jgi:hypothetical protein
MRQKNHQTTKGKRQRKRRPKTRKLESSKVRKWNRFFLIRQHPFRNKLHFENVKNSFKVFNGIEVVFSVHLSLYRSEAISAL